MELHLDGLVGPTHFYGGLGYGNLASAQNADAVSSPRNAALQGLAKMRWVHQAGVPQGLLPPRPRPDWDLLKRCGFIGSDALSAAREHAPNILKAAWSTSSMWTANAATVTASAETSDERVHLTPANLSSTLHRSTEAAHTTEMLRLACASDRFVVHDALPAALPDEGAANHMRLGSRRAEAANADPTATNIYVHGPNVEATRFRSRQSPEASKAIARLHGDHSPLFVAQSQQAIDAGAFHNDVVAVSTDGVLFCHELAFEPGELDRIRAAQPEATIVEIASATLSLDEAVASYVFNSELITTDGELLAVVEKRVEKSTGSMQALDQLVAATGGKVEMFDLAQSMANGGGPACLRLRVPVTADELAAVDSRFVLDDAAIDRLENWVADHFRDELHADDLTNPDFAAEVANADQALRSLLEL